MNMENPLLQHAEDPPAKVVHHCYKCNAQIIAGELFIRYGEVYCVECGEDVVASYGDDPDDFFDMA